MQNIARGDYRFPEHPRVSEEAKDLLRRILVVNPEKRITIKQVCLTLLRTNSSRKGMRLRFWVSLYHTLSAPCDMPCVTYPFRHPMHNLPFRCPMHYVPLLAIPTVAYPCCHPNLPLTLFTITALTYAFGYPSL